MTSAPPSDLAPIVVRLCNWVGEVVLSIPSLRRLEAAGYELHLQGRSWARALLAGHRWEVIVRPDSVLQSAAQLRRERHRLAARSAAFARERRALLLTKSLSSAFEARLAGLGAAGFNCDGRRPLLARGWPLPAVNHAAHAYWALVTLYLGEDAPFPQQLGLQIAPHCSTRARTILADCGLQAADFVVLCPFSGRDDRGDQKVWPGFPTLARELGARGISTVVCPGPGEEVAAAARFPTSLQLPGLDLGTYAALMREARAVVANDTGPAHIAAAADCALVAVYGPRSIGQWAPIGRRVRLLHPTQGWAATDEVLAATLR